MHLSSTLPRVAVVVRRIGSYRGGWSRVAYSRSGVAVRKQPSPVVLTGTRTVVARWPVTLTLSTQGWPPGAYLAEITTPVGLRTDIAFLVRSPSAIGRVVILAATQTWEAYNDWGGYSLYHGHHGLRDRALAVSYDRPDPAPGDGRWAYDLPPVVASAEALPIKVAYFSDTDLNDNPHALDGARAVVVAAHAEYLTTTERARLRQARDAGTNLLFGSANAVYWRIRLHAGVFGSGPDRLVVGYKNALMDAQAAADPAGATAKFRDPPDADPEERLVGSRYECFPVNAGFRVADSSWWGFAGTGVAVGAVLPGLVGVEADRATQTADTPRPLQVLSFSPFTCRGTPDHSTATYYTAASGAGVVDVATQRWECALAPTCTDGNLPDVTRRFVRRVMANVLTAFATGPAGLPHPARDSLDRYELPATGSPAS